VLAGVLEAATGVSCYRQEQSCLRASTGGEASEDAQVPTV
jgi:hypothetical protein